MKPIAVGIAIAVYRCGAIAEMRIGGIVLLRGQEVAAQRVRELEIGPVSAGLANDGGAARNNVPENEITQSAVAFRQSAAKHGT